MNKTRHFATGTIGFVLCSTFLGMLTGCVSHQDGPHNARGYGPPPPAYVQSGLASQDDYVYYPGYGVYYSGNRHQYVYQEGRSWVSRPAPPRVSVAVLDASPSVRLAFHDSPAMHHAAVVQQYPKHWTPPAAPHGNAEGHNENNGKEHN
jgi:hypothetical protein